MENIPEGDKGYGMIILKDYQQQVLNEEFEKIYGENTIIGMGVRKKQETKRWKLVDTINYMSNQ